MKYPFENLPLNTKRIYVMGVTKSGCKIYLPVDSTDEEVLQNKRKELQDYLDKQENSKDVA